MEQKRIAMQKQRENWMRERELNQDKEDIQDYDRFDLNTNSSNNNN